MRILKIELQNINSLKSDNPITIDFEDDKFQDVGLFAITGSTGAGKTTILDAITIAMYHSVPRFNKSNIKAGLEDVVSYGAEGALARVVFENKDVRYEAQWSMRLTTKTGKRLGNPKEEVRLKNLNTEKIIAQKKREIQGEIEQITQLNYHQFLRSVMLAQGEFAAFLSANAREKGTLLEQITGEEIYKKIGEALNDRIAQEKSALELIKAKINTEDLLTEEARKELLKEQSELSGKIKSINQDLNGIEKILGWFKKNDELEQQKHKLEEERILLHNKTEENQDTFEALKLHESAEPFRDQVSEIARVEKEIIRLNERSETLSKDIGGLTTRLEEAKVEEKNQKQKQSARESDQKTWLPKLEKVAKLDTEIENLKSISDKINAEIVELTNQLSNHQKNKNTKEDELGQAKADLDKLQSYLEKNKNTPEIEKQLTSWVSDLNLRKTHRNRISTESTSIEKDEAVKKELGKKLDQAEKNHKIEKTVLNQLKADLDKINESLTTYDLKKLLGRQKESEGKKNELQQLKTFSQNYEVFQNSKTDLAKEKEKLTKEKTILDEKILELQSKIPDAEKSLKDAEEIYDLKRAIKSYEKERKRLKEGEPCVVCGSTTHPLVKEYEKVEPSEAATEVENREKILKNLKNDQQLNEIKVTKTNTNLGTNIVSLETLHKKSNEIQVHFNDIGSEFKIEETASIIGAQDELEAALKKLSDNINTAQVLQKQKDEKNELLSSETKKVTGQEKEITRLQEQIDGLSRTLFEKQEDLKKLDLEVLELESSLGQNFSNFSYEVPPVEQTDNFIANLKSGIAIFNRKSKELLEKKNAISQLNTDIKHIEGQVTDKAKNKGKKEKENQINNEKLSQVRETRAEILPQQVSTESKRNDLQEALNTVKAELEIVTNHLNDLITQKATKEKEKQNNESELTKNKKGLQSNLLALEKDLEESIFNSRSEIEEALLDAEDKQRFTAIRKELEKKGIELKAIEKNLKENLEKLEKEKNFEKSFEDALQEKINLESAKEENQEKVGEIKTKFELDQQIKDRNKSVVAEIDDQQKVLKKWEDLRTLLGGSKDAFNTYVQRLTLLNLIQLANVHLYKLNRRYSLKMNESYKTGEELNFNLIDHYQTDEARYVDTSSGGEKFLISLALALGLSDLASNNVNIESLFIDEGFGTLDSNTLETVISTLETLQAQGKMIGVISHVENLKERIPTQIQVLKKRNGVSEVEII